jgi:uncharacterized protein YhdP
MLRGFTYEHIKTQVRLKNAVAKIENFNLKALSGNIVLTGQSHIIDKQYDLVAKVTPAISNAVPPLLVTSEKFKLRRLAIDLILSSDKIRPILGSWSVNTPSLTFTSK